MFNARVCDALLRPDIVCVIDIVGTAARSEDVALDSTNMYLLCESLRTAAERPRCAMAAFTVIVTMCTMQPDMPDLFVRMGVADKLVRIVGAPLQGDAQQLPGLAALALVAVVRTLDPQTRLPVGSVQDCRAALVALVQMLHVQTGEGDFCAVVMLVGWMSARVLAGVRPSSAAAAATDVGVALEACQAVFMANAPLARGSTQHDAVAAVAAASMYAIRVALPRAPPVGPELREVLMDWSSVGGPGVLLGSTFPLLAIEKMHCMATLLRA